MLLLSLHLPRLHLPPHLDFIQQALDRLFLRVLYFPFLERLGEVSRHEDELGALFGGEVVILMFFFPRSEEEKCEGASKKCGFFLLSTFAFARALSPSLPRFPTTVFFP